MSALEPFTRASLPALDGLRAVAVLLVIGLHLGYSRIPGYLGVLAFFVLSGFLITWLLMRELDGAGSISVRGFYCRRMLRIFPAYYMYLAVYLVYAAATSTPVDRAVVVSAVYLSDYSVLFDVPLTFALTHTWSLSVEEQFYLLWPWIFCWKAHRPKQLAVGLLCAMVAVQFWRPFLLYVVKPEERYVMHAFDAQCDGLLAGCLLAVLLKLAPGHPMWNRLTGSVWSPIASLTVLVGAFYLYWRWRPIGLSIGGAVASYVLAIFILQMIVLSDRAPWSWLNCRPLRYLGRLSYPLYLYHLLTMSFGFALADGYPLPIKIVTGLAVTLAAAQASYSLVEKPFLRLKLRFAPHASKRQASAAPAIAGG